MIVLFARCGETPISIACSYASANRVRRWATRCVYAGCDPK